MKKKVLFLLVVLILTVLAISASASAAPPTVLVPTLEPNWDTGVFSAYVGPTDYDYVSPGSTAKYLGREAGIIKAGLFADTDGHYYDEGLFAFQPAVTIERFASRPLTYDVVNQYGTNPVWMTIELDTGVLDYRNDNTVYQFVPTTNPAGWHTVDAGAGLWLQWADGSGSSFIGLPMTLEAIAAANPGLPVVRAYLRLGMGDSYAGTGQGTVAWVDKAKIGGVTYDFVVQDSGHNDKDKHDKDKHDKDKHDKDKHDKDKHDNERQHH